MTITANAPYTADQRFFSRMAMGIAAFIVFGFVQWSARGFVHIQTVPIWVHVHGLVFFAWLALFVTQSRLAERGSLDLHRRLGRAGAALVVLMVALGGFTTVKALQLHRVPPFFTDPYFLALGPVDIVGFALMVAAAVALRGDTQWHRRLMLGATVLLMEPALGRLMPPPLYHTPLPLAWLGDYGVLTERLIQLATLGVAMVHDRNSRGAVHPALLWSAGALLAAFLLIAFLAHLPPFMALAAHIAGR